MSERNDSNLFEQGRARFESAMKDLEKDWKRFQEQAAERRREFEARAEGELKRFRAELRNNPWVQRFEERVNSLREDAGKTISSQLDALFDTLRLASASDVATLREKVNELNRKLRELEQAQTEAERTHRTI